MALDLPEQTTLDWEIELRIEQEHREDEDQLEPYSYFIWGKQKPRETIYTNPDLPHSHRRLP
jgi:hypothetical protein